MYVFKLLNDDDLSSAGQVCSHWRDVAEGNSVRRQATITCNRSVRISQILKKVQKMSKVNFSKLQNSSFMFSVSHRQETMKNIYKLLINHLMTPILLDTSLYLPTTVSIVLLFYQSYFVIISNSYILILWYNI